MNQSNGPPIRVLMVEDSETDAIFFGRLLQGCPEATFLVDHAPCLSDAIAKLEACDYDIALLDLNLSDATGLDSFEKIRSLDARLPIVLLTGVNDESVGLAAIESGAQDFLAKENVSGRMLYRVLRFAIARQLKVMGIQAAADTDPLTGLPNRRYLQTMFTEFLKQAEKSRVPISFAILDVDHFKSINDKHGHFVGDVVLKSIAKTFASELGDRATAMRIGGEEFAIVMPGCEIDDACELIDSLLKKLASTPVDFDGRSIVVTASAGVTELHYDDSWDKVYVAADAALYEAKSSGRNRYQRRERASHPVR